MFCIDWISKNKIHTEAVLENVWRSRLIGFWFNQNSANTWIKNNLVKEGCILHHFIKKSYSSVKWRKYFQYIPIIALKNRGWSMKASHIYGNNLKVFVHPLFTCISVSDLYVSVVSPWLITAVVWVCCFWAETKLDLSRLGRCGEGGDAGMLKDFLF